MHAASIQKVGTKIIRNLRKKIFLYKLNRYKKSQSIKNINISIILKVGRGFAFDNQNKIP